MDDKQKQRAEDVKTLFRILTKAFECDHECTKGAVTEDAWWPRIAIIAAEMSGENNRPTNTVKFTWDDTGTADAIRDAAIDALAGYQEFSERTGVDVWERERSAYYHALIKASDDYLRVRHEKLNR